MKNLWCTFLGHKYHIYARPKEPWSIGIRWLKCQRCGKDFALNAVVQVLIPMNFEIMDMHKWQRVKGEREV